MKVNVVLVFGSEGRGLRRLVAETCDELAALPMSGPVESLNVSVAAGVFRDFEVIHRFVRVDRTATPNAQSREVYRKLMLVFEHAYRSLVDVYEEMAGLNL